MKPEFSPPVSSREQFDRQATHYDRQWNAWNHESLDWMRRQAPAAAGLRVLDVATGAGFTALAFAEAGANVVGLDVSPGMLSQAASQAKQRDLQVRWQEAPAESIPFPECSFDLVTCRIAAHHFLDPLSFLAESFRVLVPGGAFLLADSTVPDGNPEAGAWQNEVERLRDPSHVRNYSPSEWSEWVRGAGFLVLEVRSDGQGIRIPLEDWLTKSGCSGEAAERVRARFRNAPETARAAFQLETRHGPDGTDTLWFSWQRVLLSGRKPGARD